MTETTDAAPPEGGKYLRAKEVAARLNLGISTIYEMEKRGDLEGRRFGKAGSKKPALRITEASVDAYERAAQAAAQ